MKKNSPFKMLTLTDYSKPRAHPEFMTKHNARRLEMGETIGKNDVISCANANVLIENSTADYLIGQQIHGQLHGNVEVQVYRLQQFDD